MIAETPMNMASTRSHCIFTIYISCRESGSATIRRGKLHLVDLAGSVIVIITHILLCLEIQLLSWYIFTV